jgi:hypothetical protein
MVVYFLILGCDIKQLKTNYKFLTSAQKRYFNVLNQRRNETIGLTDNVGVTGELTAIKWLKIIMTLSGQAAQRFGSNMCLGDRDKKKRPVVQFWDKNK